MPFHDPNLNSVTLKPDEQHYKTPGLFLVKGIKFECLQNAKYTVMPVVL